MSTNCDQIKVLLTDYALQETSPRDAARIEGHLPQCPNCRQELDDARNMLGLLQRVDLAEELPRSIRVAGTRPVAADEGRGWWAALWNSAGRMSLAGGALACLAVGILGISQARIAYSRDGF